MDSLDTHISCQICNKKFLNILLHLKRSSFCDEQYPLGPKQKLIEFCAAKEKMKKKSDANKNEDFWVIIIIIFNIYDMQ